MKLSCLALFWCLLAGWSMADPATYSLEGRLESLQRGLDSFSITVAATEFRRSPNLDGLAPATRDWLQSRLSRPEGKAWPSYADVGSKIRLLCLSDSRIPVEYTVLQPGPCWLVIVGSHRTRSAAERAARHLSQQGLSIDCLDSTQYPPLKPGYWVCIGAAAAHASDGEKLCQQLRKRGLKDAYVRGIRR